MTYIPKAVCVECEKEYKCERNGVSLHTFTRGGQYYYSIQTDRWQCPVCGHQIILGFAQTPYNQELGGEVPGPLWEGEPESRVYF